LRQNKKYDVALKLVSGYTVLYPTATTMLVEMALLQQALGKHSEAYATYNSIRILDPYNQTAINFFNTIK